jgi:hypothetical protein
MPLAEQIPQYTIMSLAAKIFHTIMPLAAKKISIYHYVPGVTVL